MSLDIPMFPGCHSINLLDAIDVLYLIVIVINYRGTIEIFLTTDN